MITSGWCRKRLGNPAGPRAAWEPGREDFPSILFLGCSENSQVASTIGPSLVSSGGATPAATLHGLPPLAPCPCLLAARVTSSGNTLPEKLEEQGGTSVRTRSGTPLLTLVARVSKDSSKPLST